MSKWEEYNIRSLLEALLLGSWLYLHMRRSRGRKYSCVWKIQLPSYLWLHILPSVCPEVKWGDAVSDCFLQQPTKVRHKIKIQPLTWH